MKLHFFLFMRAPTAEQKMKQLEHGEDKNATSKVLHANWRSILSAMAFAIHKCRGLELDPNASVWSLDKLEQIAERKYHEEMTLREEPISVAVDTKPVSEKPKIIDGPVKRTLYDYFERVNRTTFMKKKKNRIKRTKRNKKATEMENAPSLIRKT